jgi:hypothetical protein
MSLILSFWKTCWLPKNREVILVKKIVRNITFTCTHINNNFQKWNLSSAKYSTKKEIKFDQFEFSASIKTRLRDGSIWFPWPPWIWQPISNLFHSNWISLPIWNSFLCAPKSIEQGVSCQCGLRTLTTINSCWTDHCKRTQTFVHSTAVLKKSL